MDSHDAAPAYAALAAVLEGLEQAVVVCDGARSTINAAAAALLGLAPLESDPQRVFAAVEQLGARVLNAEETEAGWHQVAEDPGAVVRGWMWRFDTRPTDLRVTTFPIGASGRVWTFDDLSDLAEATRRAEVSEEQYRLMAENATDVVWQASTDGVVLWMSDSVVDLLGWTPDEMRGRRFVEFIHPDDLHKVRGVQENLHEGGRRALEVRLRTKDGAYRWIAIYGRAVTDAEGTITGRSGGWRDIHADVLSREALASSERLLQATLDSMLDPQIALEAVRDDAGAIVDFTYVGANHAAEQANGMKGDALLGRRLLDLFPGFADNGQFAMYCSVVESGQPVSLDASPVRHDHRDEIHYYDIRIAPMGESITYTWRDVTERREVSLQIAERERLFRLLAENTTDVVALTDGDALLWVSPSVTGALGWLPEEVVGLAPEAFDHPDDVAQLREVRARALRGIRGRARARRLAKGGGYHWVEVGMGPVVDEEGRLLAVVSSMRVIDDTVAFESRLIEARAAAEVAAQAKSDFVANMSHEIRTPLTAALGLMSLLAGSDLTPVQADYVERAEIAGQALLGVLNDILDYSKLEAGRLELSETPFSLEDLLRDIGVVMAVNVGDRPINLVFDIGPQTPLHLVGDELRLRQILLNLTGNAVKFTERGMVLLEVRVAERSGGSVLLDVAVRDTGIGMSPEALDHVFDSFTQAESSTARRFGGTGLGLPLSRRLLELMGSRLDVVSEKGAGSTFSFRLELEVVPGSQTTLEALGFAPDDRALVTSVVSLGALAEERMTEDLGMPVRCVDHTDAVEELRRAAREGQPYSLVFITDPERLADRSYLGQLRTALDRQTTGAVAPLLIGITSQRGAAADRHLMDAACIDDYAIRPFTSLSLSRLVERVRSGTGAVTPAREGGQPLAGLSLLLVEDHDLNREVAHALLARAGARVTAAGEGQTAVDLVTADPHRFDAVLMDMQMPGMDGMEATRLIRALPLAADLPIIALTANASIEDRARCLEAGMSDHVAKPFDIEELSALLLRWHGPAGRNGPYARAGLLDLPGALARIDNDAEFLAHLLTRFSATLPENLAALQQAVTSGDADGVVAAAHSLRGGSAAVGAVAVSAAAGALESDAREGRDCAASLTRLQQVADETVGAVAVWLEGAR